MTFFGKEPPVLEDGRALLRPMEMGDAALLGHFAVEEPAIWTYSLASMGGPIGMESYVRTAVEGMAAGRMLVFSVFDKKAGEWAGATRFYEIDEANGAALIGYTWYGGRFQRTGLNRHCKFLMLRWAFEEWGLARVEFRADVRNERSITAMRGIGCTVEGVLREHLSLPDGTRRSSIVLSILKEEWFGHVRAELEKKLS